LSIYRELYIDLIAWKDNQDRKPLVLRGARQVGKTTLVKQFAKSYDHHITLNLERPEHFKYFQDFDNVTDLVQALLITHDIPPDQISNTLVFIDEIQESLKEIILNH